MLHPRSMLEVTFNSESATANCWHGPLPVTLHTCFKHWSWTVVQCCQTTGGHSESGFTASQCSLIGPRQTDSGKGSELKGEIVSSLSCQFVQSEKEELSYKIQLWCGAGLLTAWQYLREHSCLVSKQTFLRMPSFMWEGSKLHEQTSKWNGHERFQWSIHLKRGLASTIERIHKCFRFLRDRRVLHFKTEVCCGRNNFKQMWAFELFYLNRKHLHNL